MLGGGGILSTPFKIFHFLKCMLLNLAEMWSLAGKRIHAIIFCHKMIFFKFATSSHVADTYIYSILWTVRSYAKKEKIGCTQQNANRTKRGECNVVDDWFIIQSPYVLPCRGESEHSLCVGRVHSNYIFFSSPPLNFWVKPYEWLITPSLKVVPYHQRFS